MATTTPLQGLPVPELTDDPNVVDDINKLASAIEKRLAGVYASTADRDARVTVPQEGQIAILRDTNTVYCYWDTGWTQIFPASGLPAITSGTTVPNNATGANGDVYFKV